MEQDGTRPILKKNTQIIHLRNSRAMSLHSNPKSVTQDNPQPMLEEFHEGSILLLQKNILSGMVGIVL